MSTITSLPLTWAVPHNNSATLVDLSAWDSFPWRPNGEKYSIDALIWVEVHLNSYLCSDNWLLLFHCKIKTPRWVPQVVLLEKFLFSGLIKMILQRVSTAIMHTFIAMASIHVSILITISSKAASIMNLILTRCKSSGIVSSMQTLMKHLRKWTLFRGMDQLFTSKTFCSQPTDSIPRCKNSSARFHAL